MRALGDRVDVGEGSDGTAPDGPRGELREWPKEFASDLSHHVPEWVLTTTHPAAVLRSRNRDEDYQLLLADLRVAAEVLGS